MSTQAEAEKIVEDVIRAGGHARAVLASAGREAGHTV